ncbi:hypothetical protein BN997_02267 [Oceanobacillus oncorhynchi]|uniref:Uncharacterized protein n=1 Tax=Oceanobacillus oncorhynchi TaxID=545501 RepID=A0A0A1MU04_9BACI|nr:hypothetical protein BN997_02267 [Oceanobacillus oncorhynchi]
MVFKSPVSSPSRCPLRGVAFCVQRFSLLGRIPLPAQVYLLLFPQESTSRSSHLSGIMFYLLFHKEIMQILAMVLMGRVIAVPAPVGRPRRKKCSSFFYPRGISAAMLLSAPAGLPISKSSLKEMSSEPTESGVYFWGLRLLTPRNPLERLYSAFFYAFLFFNKNR